MTEVAGGHATLFGHSMGGLVVMIQAARSPQSVERLVLIDPAACLIKSSAPGVPTWMMLALGAYPSVGGRIAGLLPRYRGTDEMVVAALGRAFAPGRVVDPKLLEAHLQLEDRRAVLPTPYRGYIEAWRSMRNQHAESDAWVEEVLKPIRARTLLLYGADDPLIPHRWFERLARLRPDWDVASLQGTGHDPQMEAPGVFLDAVLDWLTAEAAAATPH